MDTQVPEVPVWRVPIETHSDCRRFEWRNNFTSAVPNFDTAFKSWHSS